MPYFLRTRRLDLQSLDTNPPENLALVHAILLGAVQGVQDKLKRTERNFYRPSKNALSELKKWAQHLNCVLQDARRPQLCASWQIDDVTGRGMDPSRKVDVRVFDINKLRESQRKVLDAVPNRFTDIILGLRRILKYLEKYALSFYDLASDVFLETAHNYERQRKDYICEIRKNVDSVLVLFEKFKGDGLSLSDMTFSSRELARKADCVNAPFLLLFPEICENLYNACSLIITWIAADANYSTFLANDITDLEQQMGDLSKALRDFQHKFHQLNFRLKQVQSGYDKIKPDVEKLRRKEDELLVDEEALATESNEMQLEIEGKEYRRDELIKNASSMQSQILYEKYSEISEEVRELKMRLPYVKRQLKSVKSKLGWIAEKKKEMKEVESDLNRLQEDAIQVEAEKNDSSVRLEVVSRSLGLARRLYLYKRSPDAVNKIFHDQPVSVNNHRLPGRGNKHDPFDAACKLISEKLDADWPKFYRNLPFFPTRGNNTIDRDIADLGSYEAREGVEATVLRALTRWRRFHIRAKLADLQGALATIHRGDIGRHLVSELNLNGSDGTPGNDQTYDGMLSSIDPELVPFLKQVERFDELRAAHRI